MVSWKIKFSLLAKRLLLDLCSIIDPLYLDRALFHARGWERGVTILNRLFIGQITFDMVGWGRDEHGCVIIQVQYPHFTWKTEKIKVFKGPTLEDGKCFKYFFQIIHSNFQEIVFRFFRIGLLGPEKK